MAMSGALLAQTPLALLLEHVSWRQALWVDAGFGVIVFLIIAVTVKDFPSNEVATHEKEQQTLKKMGYGKSFRLAFLRGQNWLAGGYASLMNLIVILLGGTWGKLYLVNTHGVSPRQASYVTSLLFFGALIGGPLAGRISDMISNRRLPMIVGAIICFILVVVLMSLTPNFPLLLGLFLAMGIVTSTQIISYPFVAENSPRSITAMSVSVVNISTQVGLFFAEPLFGYLVDLKGGSFTWAMALYPLSFLLALIMVLKLHETPRT